MPGSSGTTILTVGSAAPATPENSASKGSTSLTDKLEIRQEMIQLINQTRRGNGISKLLINELLMNAAQTCSDRCNTCSRTPEESQAAVDAGYPDGVGVN